jgi:hypothetical protein
MWVRLHRYLSFFADANFERRITATLILKVGKALGFVSKSVFI